MGQFEGYHMAVAILNLIGSLSSTFGAGFIALCYCILPLRRHFRHSLILNLAIADLLNGINNATSGILILSRRRDMSLGVGCTINGLIGQITVQATDCSILAIAIVTIFAVTRKTSMNENSRTREALICASTWILPCITGFFALSQHYYSPVSGNWCWLVQSPVYLRYVLTHGWRMVFIFVEIALYAYLHFYLRSHFKNVKAACSTHELNSRIEITNEPNRLKRIINEKKEIFRKKSDSSINEFTQPMVDAAVPPYRNQSDQFHPIELSDVKPFEIEKRIQVETGFDRYPSHVPANQIITTITSEHHNLEEDSPSENVPTATRNPFAHHRASLEAEKPHPRRMRSQSMSRSSKIRKVLLLNAYPAAYIILWIPGILNRLVEASGNKSPALQVMQASTQFVGLANAITYGWNERIAHQLVNKFSRKKTLPGAC